MTVGNTLVYDTEGSLVAYGSGKNILIVQTSDNFLERGISFRNSKGSYIGSIYIKDAGSNTGTLTIAGTTTIQTDVNSLTDYVKVFNDGKVLIGSGTSTSYLLDVAGTLNIQGAATFSGNITASSGTIRGGTITLSTNAISTTTADQDLILNPNGTGSVQVLETLKVGVNVALGTS